MKRKIKITVGGWLFRFRSFTPLPLLVLCLILFRPQWMGWWITPVGLLISLLGEGLRMVAVGWSYGGTSGREAYLRADRLNTAGIYSMTRNPLYIGNILIFSGLSLAFGNPWVLLIMCLFLMLQYHLIVVAEETYLLEKYGAEYRQYQRDVSRFFPRIRRVRPPDHPFSWKKVLLKENDSVFNLGVVAWGIHHYRMYLADGFSHPTLRTGLPLLIWVVLYIAIKWYKKRNKKKDGLN